MLKPKLIIVTGNPLKFREISTALSAYFDCEQQQLENYDEIQGKPENIIRKKLEAAYEKFQQSVLVDDTSVHFEALNGFPGPYIKDFWGCYTPYEMGVRFVGSRIKIVCHVGVMMSPENIIFVEGITNGLVVEPKTKDDKGTEFDLFVQVDGTDGPMIEFTTEEKNRFSHRGLAIQNLLLKLPHTR